jgi:hypothetical protein
MDPRTPQKVKTMINDTVLVDFQLGISPFARLFQRNETTLDLFQDKSELLGSKSACWQLFFPKKDRSDIGVVLQDKPCSLNPKKYNQNFAFPLGCTPGLNLGQRTDRTLIKIALVKD